MQRSGRPSRLGLGLVLVAALLTLFLGFAHKASCLIGGDFERRAYRTFCYSDLVPLYGQEGLSGRKVPYLEARNEYPVLTGLFMWGASLFSKSEGSFLFVNALALMALGLVTAAILHRLVGERALFFSLAPALAFYGSLNWDLLPVALATAGIAAFLWRRDAAAGLLLGLGAAAKVYPAFVAIPLCLDRLREGDRRGAVRIAGFGVAAWLVVNLPLALAAFERWSYFFRFSSSRPPTPGTLWYAACRGLTGEDGCGAVGALNALSALLFVVGAVVLWRAFVRRDDGRAWRLAFPLVALFLLTSKVYSPQYSLWLLPFFAPVLPDVRWFALFAAADAAVFVTELSWLGRVKGFGGLPAWPLGVAVVARAAVLVGLIVVVVTRRPVGPEPAPHALTNTSPSSSS